METIKLAHPIDAHGETVTQITIRKPKGGDVMDIGVPFKTEANGTALPDMGMMGAYISKLAGIPVSSVRNMEVADLMQAVQVVAGFFGETTLAPTESDEESS